MTATSNYGTDLSGTYANRPTNAPAGITYYCTDLGLALISNGDGTFTSIGNGGVNVTITSAQLLALNATEQTLVAAPGANQALIFQGAMLYKAAGTAYAGVASGEDLSVKYTDDSGLAVGGCETTGFLDQTTAQSRWVNPYHAASGVSSITPVANSPLVLHLLTGEITTGDSDLIVQVHFKIVPTVLS